MTDLRIRRGQILSDLVDEVGEYLRGMTVGTNIEVGRIDFFDVMLGLLARQYQLWAAVIMGPSSWTHVTAPLLMRGLVDAHITLSWIGINPESAKKYKI